jgi:hypothetical protein
MNTNTTKDLTQKPASTKLDTKSKPVTEAQPGKNSAPRNKSIGEPQTK